MDGGAPTGHDYLFLKQPFEIVMLQIHFTLDKTLSFLVSHNDNSPNEYFVLPENWCEIGESV
jgi:hypothetical protein